MKPLVYKKSRRARAAAREPERHKLHVAKGDTVRVISGEHRGKEGKVLRVFPKQFRVVGAADPGATPRGEEPKVAPDPAAPPKGKEPKPKKPKKGPGGEARPAEPEGPPPEPAPPPRLHEYYEQRVRPKLAQQFGFKNA